MQSIPENSPAVEVAGVSCNHCGAPLAIPADTRFASCTYCGARLEVFREGGAAYTRVLDDIDERTKRIEAGVDALNHRERLEQLDREWMISRDQYLVRGRNGGSLPTDGVLPIVISVAMSLFGVFWICIALAGGAGIMVPFGIVFIVVAIAGGVSASNKANQYSQAEKAYQRRRRGILSAMDPISQDWPTLKD